jgi:hypothetical protein
MTPLALCTLTTILQGETTMRCGILDILTLEGYAAGASILRHVKSTRAMQLDGGGGEKLSSSVSLSRSVY